MVIPQKDEVFVIEGGPNLTHTGFGIAIHNAENWRLTQPTEGKYTNYDGEEPIPIGLVKYHEMKTYAYESVTVSTDCFDTARQHWEKEGFDTLFWFWYRLRDGKSYQFKGLATFSDLYENDMFIASKYGPGYFLLPRQLTPWMLDL